MAPAFVRSLAAVLLLLWASAVRAQDTESVNAQNTFNVAGTIYNRTGSLEPVHFALYGIPVPTNATDPDILLTLNSTTGGTGLGIYCNPGYGAFADPNGATPGPGYAQWYSGKMIDPTEIVNQVGMPLSWLPARGYNPGEAITYSCLVTDLSTTVNQIFISKNDPYYRSPTANSSAAPFFLCSVINNDANTTTNYTLVANIISSNRTLDQGEQSLLGALYNRCCLSNSSCGAWKSQNNGYVSANGDSVDTDFCTFPNQICSPTGNLYRLNLQSYNLSCAWPGDLLAQFPQLSTLALGSNPSLRGNTSAVFTTVANLTNLQFLDLSGDTGLTGTIDSGSVNNNLCKAAQGNLVSLNLNSIGLSGNIPSCLYSQGSGLISIDLGSNNLTGTLQNTIPSNSSLQLLHVDYNQLTGALPASLANARYLADLDTTMNKMSGTIPAGIGNITTLRSFVVKMNNHSGAIPDSFGTALNLEVFDAKLNMLTSLPAAWTNASYNAINASYINVRASLNRIASPFPVGLANAQQLTFLVLNENNMTGPLPSLPTMFPNLRALNVSFNNLNGSIPTAWNQTGIFSSTPLYLSNGVVFNPVFDISHNRLTGGLPSFLAQNNVPTWAQEGIYLQGNNLTVNCANSSFSYIMSVCPNGNATTSSSQTPAASPPTAVATNTTATPPTGASVATPPPRGSAAAGASPANVTSQAAQQPERRSSSGLSGGAIAGIVIGVLAALALAVLLALFLLRRRRSGKAGVQKSAFTPPAGGAFGNPGATRGVPETTSNPAFDMPTFNDEPLGSVRSSVKSQRSNPITGIASLGSKNSGLKSAISSLSGKGSGFEKFEDDEQQDLELSRPTARK